jgi:hypothetical protein
MVQKIHPRGVIWIPSISPHAGRLSEKKWRLSCPVWRCPWLTCTLFHDPKPSVCLFLGLPMFHAALNLHNQSDFAE